MTTSKSSLQATPLCDFETVPCDDGRFVHTCRVCTYSRTLPSERYFRPCKGKIGTQTDASNAKNSPPDHGLPGTELKKLLKKFFVGEEQGCGCNKRAAEMDRRGPDWCEQNIETIVGWLRSAAKLRKLPFVEFAARAIVRRAIKNARKAEAAKR
jgi:hypothetical protein